MTISTTTLKNAARAIECDLWTDPATGANYLAKDGAILRRWEPLLSDMDAFNLMLALRIDVNFYDGFKQVQCKSRPLNGQEEIEGIAGYGSGTHKSPEPRNVRAAILSVAARIGAAL